MAPVKHAVHNLVLSGNRVTFSCLPHALPGELAVNRVVSRQPPQVMVTVPRRPHLRGFSNLVGQEVLLVPHKY